MNYISKNQNAAVPIYTRTTDVERAPYTSGPLGQHTSPRTQCPCSWVIRLVSGKKLMGFSLSENGLGRRVRGDEI